MTPVLRPLRTAWDWMRRLPLRVQLVVTLLVLLAAVLIGSYFVASTSMQNYLLNQLDVRLNRTMSQVRKVLATGQLPELGSRFPTGKSPIGPTDQIVVRVGRADFRQPRYRPRRRDRCCRRFRPPPSRSRCRRRTPVPRGGCWP